MPVVNLICGLILEQSDVQRILNANTNDVEWAEEAIPQHADIDDVQQWKIYPLRIAGAVLPNELVAYGVRTLVLRGEDSGKLLFGVDSSADYIRAGRLNYSYAERKTSLAHTISEVQETVLSEYKRFLRINLQT